MEIKREKYFNVIAKKSPSSYKSVRAGMNSQLR